MVYTREMERVVRDLLRSQTDVAYIRHYLMETFAADEKTIQIVFRKLGIDEHGAGGGAQAHR